MSSRAPAGSLDRLDVSPAVDVLPATARHPRDRPHLGAIQRTSRTPGILDPQECRRFGQRHRVRLVGCHTATISRRAIQLRLVGASWGLDSSGCRFTLSARSSNRQGPTPTVRPRIPPQWGYRAIVTRCGVEPLPSSCGWCATPVVSAVVVACSARLLEGGTPSPFDRWWRSSLPFSAVALSVGLSRGPLPSLPS